MVVQQWLVRRLSQRLGEQTLGRRIVTTSVGCLARLVEIRDGGSRRRHEDQYQEQRESSARERFPPARGGLHCRSAFRSTQLIPSGKRNLVTVSTLSLEPLNHASCSHSTPWGSSTLMRTALPAPSNRIGRTVRVARPSLSGT